MKDNHKKLGTEISDMIAAYKSSINIHTMSRISRIPDSGNNRGTIELFFEMIGDYRKNKYKLISESTIITFILSIVYVISPIDIIPDGIGIVGLLDDMAVIAFAIRSCYEELCAYKLWLATRDLPLKEAYRLIKETMSEYEDYEQISEENL